MTNVGYNVICQSFDALFLFIVHENSALICLASVLLKINLLLESYYKVLWWYVGADDILALFN